MNSQFHTSTRADYEAIEKLAGLFIGQLNGDEMESFRRCCRDGLAYEDHSNALQSLMIGGRVGVR